MTLWFWIHFFSFLIYIFLFAFVLGKNFRNYLNLLVAGLIFCFALWSFGNAMMFNNFSTIKSSKIMLKIASPGWIFFSAFYLLFIFEFTEKPDISRNKKFIFLIFLLPALFYLFNIFNQFIDCCDETFYGYTGIWKNIIWVKLFYVYYIFSFLLGIFLLIKYTKETKNIIKKRTSFILMNTMIFCFIAGSLTSVIMKETKNYVPIEANIFLIVFAFGIVYAMFKYQFLSITPYKATESILNTIDEGIILLNNEGQVKNTNYIINKIFESNEENIKENEQLKQIIYDRLEILKYKSIINEEIEVTVSDNNKKVILLSANLLKENKENIGYLFIIREITELKDTKIELERTIKKLKDSNKELERFAYIASHDLKEPLRMVSSYIELLAKRFKNKIDDEANDFINYAVSGIERMNKLINNLLECAKFLRDEIEIENVNVKDVLDEVLQILKFKIEFMKANVKIVSDMPVIKVNRLEILRVFQNLIDNALKFNEGLPVIEIDAFKNEKEYVFFIKDNGIGIKKENKDKIFEIFQKLNYSRKYEGNGIGLATCKKIIEKYNGKIWVESEEDGGGSIFYFSIPEQSG